MKVHDIFSSCSIVSDSPDNDINAIYQLNTNVNLNLTSANQACKKVIFDKSQQYQLLQVTLQQLDKLQQMRIRKFNKQIKPKTLNQHFLSHKDLLLHIHNKLHPSFRTSSPKNASFSWEYLKLTANHHKEYINRNISGILSFVILNSRLLNCKSG